MLSSIGCQQSIQKDKFSIPKELLKGIQSKFDEKELHIQEERRLFYVAITRAKEKLIITYAKRYGENKTDSKPSRFLTEIDYQQNENIDFQQADPQELSAESTTKENQTQTRLMKQVISNLTTGKFNEAIENVLLFAKSTNKDLRYQSRINRQNKRTRLLSTWNKLMKNQLQFPKTMCLASHNLSATRNAPDSTSIAML